MRVGGEIEMEFDVNKRFVVPDDMNQKQRLWVIRFNDPVSAKKLLDALSKIKCGGDILRMKHVRNEETGKMELKD